VVSFIADAPDAPRPAPVALSPLAADGGPALLDEACPPRPIVSRAADAPSAASGSKSP